MKTLWGTSQCRTYGTQALLCQKWFLGSKRQKTQFLKIPIKVVQCFTQIVKESQSAADANPRTLVSPPSRQTTSPSGGTNKRREQSLCEKLTICRRLPPVTARRSQQLQTNKIMRLGNFPLSNIKTKTNFRN